MIAKQLFQIYEVSRINQQEDFNRFTLSLSN